jgi:hypothetical protein
LQLLDIGGDVDALNRRDLPHAARREPVEELDGRARIGAARVRVANVGGEEFEEAIGGSFALGGDKNGGAIGGAGDELVHHQSLDASSDSVTNWMLSAHVSHALFTGVRMESPRALLAVLPMSSEQNKSC